MTEMKRIEADLAYERDLLRALLENAPDCIYFKERESRLIKCSKSPGCQTILVRPMKCQGAISNAVSRV